MQELKRHINKFEPDMSAADLKSELQRFIEQWPRLKQTVVDAYENPESEQCDEDGVNE